MCSQGEALVELRNTGAWDIENGVYTWIIEDQYLAPLNERSKEFSLKGKTQFDPLGGFDASHRLKFRSLVLPRQLETYFSPLILQACYPYRTWASVPVCVDPDVRNIMKQKPCVAGPVALSGGQGAPVAVTRVETSMLPLPEGNKVQPVFAIFVQNMGYGSVVRESDFELACKAGEKVGREKLLPFADVYVELQERKLDCKPVDEETKRSVVRIESGQESKFVCQSPDMVYDMSAGTFSTVLTVELRYGYVNTATFPVTITRLPQQKEC
jgi:hypothetical protein